MRAAVLTAFLAGLVGAGAAQAAPPPAGFYKPPSPLPAFKPGDLLRSRTLTGSAALSAASRSKVVLYRSVSPRGKAVAVSGVVSVPKGRPPAGGWPTVSYGHGSVGIADRCAPSRDSRTSPAHDGIAYAYPFLNGLLKSGYAVVRTDYEGSGTPGLHPHAITRSEGRSMVDILRAAREAVPGLSRDWVAVGHSQGGGAALGAGALAAKARGLRLRGVASFAPGARNAAILNLAKAVTTPTPLSNIGALLVGSVQSQGLRVLPLLGPKARALVPRIETECRQQLAEPDSWGGLAPAEIVRPGADTSTLKRFLDAQSLSRLRLRVPVLVQQAKVDDLTPELDTADTVVGLRRNGAKVTYRVYSGTDHRGVINVGLPRLKRFLASRFR